MKKRLSLRGPVLEREDRSQKLFVFGRELRRTCRLHKVAPVCAGILPGDLCARIGCVSGRISLARQLGFELDPHAVSKVLQPVDEPLFSWGVERFGILESVRGLRRALKASAGDLQPVSLPLVRAISPVVGCVIRM